MERVLGEFMKVKEIQRLFDKFSVKERKLASVQIIEKLELIEGADFIERATVLGWHCVVRKGDFREKDKCIYIEIDSMLPDISAFEFLKDPKGRVPEVGFVHRLKTKRLKGQISQGLVMSLKDFPKLSVKVGDDVTVKLGIKKYEPPVLASLRVGQAKSTFPSFIPRTDETRVQNIPWITKAFQGKQVYVTVKLDGTSATYYVKKGQFGVCSHNMEWKKPVPEPVWRTKLLKFFAKLNSIGFGTKLLNTCRTFGYLRNWQADAKNTYWEVAEQLQMEHRMKDLGGLKNCAIQGEICGPGIQKNRLGLKENRFFVFDVYDIDNRCYLNYPDQISFTDKQGLHRVPMVGIFEFDWKTVDEVLKAAEGKYENGHNREGIVVRTCEETSWPRLGRGSFKAVNNSYLLEGGD
jgi:RNA ligase (TIGR02306 family)